MKILFILLSLMGVGVYLLLSEDEKKRNQKRRKEDKKEIKENALP
jgi:preprotein translocase subunit YajC